MVVDVTPDMVQSYEVIPAHGTPLIIGVMVGEVLVVLLLAIRVSIIVVLRLVWCLIIDPFD